MTLHEFNILPKDELKETLLRCCGSVAWVNKILPFIPADDLVELLEDAEEQWWLCTEEDWKQAFAAHPKIGDQESLKKKHAVDPNAGRLATAEQSGAGTASHQTLEALMEGNRLYEEKFGYNFIVCATGRSAEEMLGMLQSRLQNSPEEEIKLAADEQNKITKLRLEKLLE